MDSSGFKYDAIISYSRKDAAFASALQKKIENNFTQLPKDIRGSKEKLYIIRDQEDFGTAERLSEEIKNKISQSKHFIILCSKNTKGENSYWVNREIEYFKQLRGSNTERKIIPIYIDSNEADGSDTLPLQLSAIANDLPLGIHSKEFKLKKNYFPGNDTIDDGCLKIYSVLINKSFGELKNRQDRYAKQQKQKRFAVNSVIISVILLSISFTILIRTEFVISEPATHPLAISGTGYSTAMACASDSLLARSLANGNIALINLKNNKTDTLAGLKGWIIDLKIFGNYVLASSVDTSIVICWDLKTLKPAWIFKNPGNESIRSIEFASEINRFILGGDDGDLWITDTSGKLCDSLILDQSTFGSIWDIDIQNELAAVSLDDYGFLVYNLLTKKIIHNISLTQDFGSFTCIHIRGNSVYVAAMQRINENTYDHNIIVGYYLPDGKVIQSEAYPRTIDKIIPISGSDYFFISDWGGELRVLKGENLTEITKVQLLTNAGKSELFGFDYIKDTKKLYMVNNLGEIKIAKAAWLTFFDIEVPSPMVLK